MTEHRDRGVVLRARPYREADLLLTLFGEGLGKVSAIARGARRPASAMGAATQVLALSGLRLVEGRSSLWTLAGAELEALYPRVRQDFERTGRAAMLADAVDELTSDHDPAPGMFAWLVGGLAALDGGERPRVVFVAALWQMLREAGLAPPVDTCHVCAAPLPADASWRDGHGPVCPGCRRPGDAPLAPGVLTLLRHWSRLEPDRLGQGQGPDRQLAQLEHLVTEHLLYHTGRVPRAFRFWRQVAGFVEEGRKP
jgi:DNA repair protein RecO (recombination protein O)